MIKFSPSDIAFIKENFENFEELIKAEHINDILFPIDRLILTKGFQKDYEQLNEFGRRAQQVHDHIYYNN